MAESESSSNTNVVPIFAILLMIMIAGFVAWRAGVFGGNGNGGDTHHSLDINVNSK
jgi:hypothetical protein